MQTVRYNMTEVRVAVMMDGTISVSRARQIPRTFTQALLTTGSLTLCLRAWFLLLKNKISFFLMTWLLKQNNSYLENQVITLFTR